jgi:hypothetical protein
MAHGRELSRQQLELLRDEDLEEEDDDKLGRISSSRDQEQENNAPVSVEEQSPAPETVETEKMASDQS